MWFKKIFKNMGKTVSKFRQPMKSKSMINIKIGETVEVNEEIKEQDIDHDYAECAPRKLNISSVKKINKLNNNTENINKTSNYSMEQQQQPEESVRRLLERELRLLDPRDLRSHAWYHGSTLRGGRKGAEIEVPNDGDFLVRDCASQPGNYVLTVRWKGQPLHFVINRVVLQPETVYERAQYQFEDEAFDTVADLITFYVGSGRPISQASGARIISPKPRTVPLTCVAPSTNQHCSSPSSLSLSAGSPPRLPRKQQRSHSLTPQQQHNIDHETQHGKFHQQQLNNNNNNIQSSTLPRVPSIQNQLPASSLSLGRQKITRAYQASGSDSGNGSGDSEFETNNSGGNNNLPMPIKGVVIRSHYNQLNDGQNGNGNEYELSAEEQLVIAAPSFEITTLLDIEGFTTLLLPTGEHRPLDPTALRGVAGMLHDSAPRVIASHLTRLDLELVLQPGIGSRYGLSGLELATLPHGHQARLDLIERSECIKLLVAVTVLAGATAIERAATISKWIKIAIDTKTALGNLYGFCGVMLGLCLPQIQKLSNTWHLLRQKHTDEAFNFEAKLRPTLRAMNECTNPQAPNTTLPHLLPIALLGERGAEDIMGTVTQSGLAGAILSPWESSASDCGLSIVWAHLEAARKLAGSLPLYRRNAEIALEGSRSDELLTDAFRTEFHIKFLWGSRGTSVASEERHLKFTQVLEAMYDKCVSSEAAA
ncbi:breast cancer anti-estrogen resistance protein 3 homolog isoform X2 [Aphidius gifuensis]|uniref:breast cancer anti-estrogen resistance protein 3 homolog isoform X2 n=1 Tax=Aphidius gifuensis TaxID=684658 RepID=UPI001CDBBF1D|nr:breast cancer anti-estrogen resistance protein 3 homolog isoform X2 [Aphidius gifuensis]